MHKKFCLGFTLIETILVVAILALLTAVAVPNIMKSRQQTLVDICKSNMTMIDAAIQQWALEENIALTTDVSANASKNEWKQYLRNETIPTCPFNAATYTYGVSSTLANYTVTCPDDTGVGGGHDVQ
ncbi:MAG: prepilin-type N-terminal cleavage/methylation domain-containing protein [Candidatus Omnitrophica bacterium]|nr:prepilin-type N-terminal cleavage/methylation domain-containing protein [Candidatus Omnitrophota bacterium]